MLVWMYLCSGKSARPAPAELPQDRKVARVGGCSGAMFGLPFFVLPRFFGPLHRYSSQKGPVFNINLSKSCLTWGPNSLEGLRIHVTQCR